MKRIVIITLAALIGISLSAAEIQVADAAVSSQIFKKSKAEIKEVIFHAHLHCNNCVKKIQENISFEKGVKGLEVSLEKQTIAVRYDAAKTSVEILKAAIEKLNVPVKSVEYPKGE
jgi:copper chaperone CopZ